MTTVTTNAPPPEVEVLAKAERRTFTAEYKRKILQQVDAATEPGAIAAILRREGIYSSHLATWRAARERGELAGLAPKRRGPKPAVRDPRDKRIADLERENARVTARLRRAEGLIELQKKVADLLRVELPPVPPIEEAGS